ncbi:ATP-grasp domain-containing protein [Streptomyces sp. XM4193]|uniref:acetyl/propionyl/methylcrotonyl-CoA carboxylase subunit alpha n=1 Tax=Streptomyces sp. XM4193 TaxID=2929782 RepID=UPI001FF9A9AD|nr:biotin carboxylase N-terminal domain-containing protein [Streptomyces sp. XM4193]MCK1796701.1 ATP-grasp domain-containing protein [Streptomyces sp. XM4193]
MSTSSIQCLLVANRGEIARRVFRTCRELGITTVAVHSDADARAAHTLEADAAVRLAGDAPADTYLRGDLLVRAALTAGADAVHPGYGFLSESADFAEQVREAGLLWVGPPPSAIRAMAVKTRAKELMRTADVPLLEPLDPAAVTERDFPLLVKAAAGGGGRGMRAVREPAALEGELGAAAQEAAAAFGDGEVFLEPLVERGRHVEVQILADAHGTVWALGTRDCSVQRRHQKVVEEAPAPGLEPELREQLHAAAVRAARAVGYTGAGTVEFLLAPDGRPYFLEMNTRLQVEHPVTEAVHGVDLVALQLAVAEGQSLPAQPPPPTGHAVEARLYAEDPARDWQPGVGTVHRFELPLLPGLRVDSAVVDGDTVTPYYDPMLAKVIAHAPTREAAVRKLAGALAAARLHGPVTNRELLVATLQHPEFLAGAPDTGFYDRHLTALLRAPGERAASGEVGADTAALALALADAQGRSRFGTTVRSGSGAVAGVGCGWRNVRAQPQRRCYRLRPDDEEFAVDYRLGRDGLRAPGHPGTVLLHADPDRVELELEGVRRWFTVARYPDGSRCVDSALGSWTFTEVSRFPDASTRTEPGSLLAPMPGTVTRIADGLAVGGPVEAGRPLLWLEAMKMEHLVAAPAGGSLTALNVAVGDQVEVGTLLAVVGPPTPEDAPEDETAHVPADVPADDAPTAAPAPAPAPAPTDRAPSGDAPSGDVPPVRPPRT